MRVDFYHLTRDPADKLVPVLAQKTLDAGQRLLVISSDPIQRQSLSDALWNAGPGSFLAHGDAGEHNARHQPILLSDDMSCTNGADYALVADGQWRDESLAAERVFYLFTPDHVESARAAWKSLAGKDHVTRHYWKQDGGRWQEQA